METEIFQKGGYTMADARVVSEYGIHARPSALIAMKCGKYPKRVFLTRVQPPADPPGEERDAKSVLELMMLEGVFDSVIRVKVEGTDRAAREFCEQLRQFISSDLESIMKVYEEETGRKWVVR